MSHRRLRTHKIHHGPGSREATTFPHIVYSVPFLGALIQMAFLSRDSQMEVPKSPRLELPRLCGTIISCAGLKRSCSPRQELSNNVSHATCTQGHWVDSRLFVVGSQTASLIPDLFFYHNVCFKCPNGSCKPILDI
jgi:hypothetical protein